MLRRLLPHDTEVTCRRVDEQMEAYLDGALPATRLAALQAHIENCSECQKLLRQEQLRIHRLRREAQRDNWSFSPDMAEDIQRNVYRRMRRAIVVQNMKLATQGIVAAAIFLLMAAVFIWWQKESPTTITDRPTTPNADTRIVATDTQTEPAMDVTPEEDGKTIATPAATADLSLPADTTGPVTLRLAVYDYDLVMYERLVDAFEAEYPNIHVELVTESELLGGQSVSDLPPEEARLKMATGADVLAVHTSGESIREGLRLDLTPFIAADSNLDPDDFYPGLLEGYQSGGKVWAIPLEADFTLLVYNKDLFDAAGLAYPDANWSWEELLDTAKALTVGEGNEVRQWGFLDKYVGIGQPFPGLVGLALTSDGAASRPRFSNPDFIAGMQWYVDLFLTHKVAPYPSDDFNSLDALNAFLSQAHSLIQSDRVAMWTDNSAFLTNSFIPNDANWGVVPLPGCSPANSSAISISAGTQHPAAAWQLVSFLSEQSIVAGSINDLPQMPARRSVAQAGGFYEREQVNSELANTLRHAVEDICPTHTVYNATAVGTNESLASLNRALAQILGGKQPVRAALLQAQEEAEQTIAELLVTKADATPIPPFTVAPGSNGETTPSENAITVQFRVFGGAEEAQAYHNLAQRFTAANPDIAIEIESTGTTSGIAANAAQSDCFQGFSSFSRDELSSVLALDPLLNADAGLSHDDFYPLALNAFTNQGQLWSLPGQIDITLMAYNKDLFDAAGIPHPTVDWTMADFLTAAQALTQGEGENKQYGFVPGSFESTDLLDWLERLGADLVDETAEPLALNFTDPSTVAAMQWYADLTLAHGVRPTFAQGVGSLQNSEARRVLIADGRAAMWIDSAFSQRGNDNYGDRVGFVPLPTGAGNSSTLSYQSLSGYFISAETQERRACWQWITFLTEQLDAGSGLPARRIVAESAAYRERAGQERASAQITSVARATQQEIAQRLLGEAGWLARSAQVLLAEALGQIINEGANVEAVLNEAQEAADAYRACVIEQGALSNPGAQQTCLAEVEG